MPSLSDFLQSTLGKFNCFRAGKKLLATDSAAAGIQTIQAADTGEMKRKGKEQKPGISLQSHLAQKECQLILKTWNKEEESCNFTDITSPFIKFKGKKIDHIVPLVQAFYFTEERMQLRNGCDMVIASSWQNQDKKPSLLTPNPGLSLLIFCSLSLRGSLIMSSIP